MRPFSIKIVDEAGVAIEYRANAVDRRDAFINAVGYCVERNIQPSDIKARPAKPVQEKV